MAAKGKLRVFKSFKSFSVDFVDRARNRLEKTRGIAGLCFKGQIAQRKCRSKEKTGRYGTLIVPFSGLLLKAFLLETFDAFGRFVS
jgi:hypothetical protein